MTYLTPGVIQTFTALLLAHVLADFIFQTRWIVAHKRNVFVLLLHIAIVFCLTAAALGGVWEVAIPVAYAHFVIDGLRVWVLPERLRDTFGAFLGDQAAHLVTLAAAALLWPGAAGQSLWAPWLDIATVPALVLSGFVLTVIAGGHAVGLLTARFQLQMEAQEQEGLRDAGRVIGQLERTLIFMFVMASQPAGVGFLIAAKSLYSFDKNHRLAQYVIIGTFSSFAWALAIAYATRALLEIAGPTP